MRADIRTDPRPLLKPLAASLVCVVLAGILRNYPRYLPPDFTSDFLLGREDSFHGGYQWAFYAHLAAGPVTLLLGRGAPAFRRPGVARPLRRRVALPGLGLGLVAPTAGRVRGVATHSTGSIFRSSVRIRDRRQSGPHDVSSPVTRCRTLPSANAMFAIPPR